MLLIRREKQRQKEQGEETSRQRFNLGLDLNKSRAHRGKPQKKKNDLRFAAEFGRLFSSQGLAR